MNSIVEQNNKKGFKVTRELIKAVGSNDAINLSALVYGFYIKDRTKYLRIFKKKGYIENVKDPEVVKDYLCKKNNKGRGIGYNVCEWCEIKTVTLHKHHYPVEQCNGGTEKVNICANCHQEFHTINDQLNFKLTEDYKIFFNE